VLTLELKNWNIRFNKILNQVKESNSAVFDIGLGVFQFEITLKTTFGDGSESSQKK
jgi:hypothetical protein